jgi:hypothetical protein
VAEPAGATARRRAAARDRRRGRAGAGKQGRGREVVGEYPHPDAKPLERLFIGGKRWSGDAASSQSLAMAAAVELLR